jgi:transposase
MSYQPEVSRVAQLVAGVDPHKRSMTFALVTAAGAQVTTASFDNTAAGVAAALRWLGDVEQPVARVGVEGSAGHGRHLAEALVEAGIDVREVPPRRTAERRRARRRAKTDREDALAIARATAGEPELGRSSQAPRWARPFDELAVVREHRNLLVAHRQVMLNRAEAALGALPQAITDTLGGGHAVWPRLRAVAALDPAEPTGAGTATGAVTARLAMLGELYHDIAELDQRLRHLDRRMSELITACGSTLTSEKGIGVVGAATLLIEVGDPARFRSEASFNRWWGGAPIAVSSGEGHGRPTRHRLDLLGNRAVNSVVYTASVTQARCYKPARSGPT